MPNVALAYQNDPDAEPIFVRADPNGLAFDRLSHTLYVADAHGGRVLRVAGGRVERLAAIDSGGFVSANRLGGIAVTPYGTAYVARVGHGRAGAVFEIEPDGQISKLDLPARFWRLGVAYDAVNHALYSTQFMKSPSGPFDGSIVRTDLATGTTSKVVDGLLKPVGVAKLGSTLIVSDARQRIVYRVELVNGVALSRTPLVTDVDRPDSLCAVDAYSVLLTTYDEQARRGAVRRVWLDGRVHTIASGAWQPRGVATDGDRVLVSARRSGRVLVFPLMS
jgi:sugar lactone lactonase YvrE